MVKTHIMDKNNNTIKEKLKNIENFVFDLDGTLLKSDHQISPKSVETIEKLKKDGKKIIFCSGRPWYFIKKYYFALKPDFPIISCNGSLIYDYKNESVVFSKTFSPSQVLKIFKSLAKNQVFFLIYTTKNMLAFSQKQTTCPWFSFLKNENENFSEAEKLPLEFYDYESLSQDEISSLDVVKFLLIKRDSNLELFEKSIAELENVEGIYFVQSQSSVIDIMISGSNKGQGLNYLEQNYDLNLDKTLSFGDAKNDISMFAQTKLAIAMGQAHEEVKQHADYITDSNDAEGIANFFSKYYG
ncbi:HAD family hydrolase [Mesomycoplasma ovipneumoniae]|uniref:HAD family hydrolase n=1 Tax=Mesomycoplasma ovipneumoniae TaxID=29562 RepID=UPI0029651432|nr:HAD family hydrolase [Mesomycoplasma ovipneumoniae]MDW2912012.1 HAD family hydrolase [Mesomycoplasma ovipneumoniae]